MKLIVLFLLILILSPIIHAQIPDTLWTRTFGGFFNDYGNSVDISPDGGYIVAGETYSPTSGSYDIYLIKITAEGDTLWSRTYGGANSEYGRCVIQTSDSGFAVVGETRSFGAGSYDIYFLKTDAAGDTNWAKTYGGDQYEEGRSVFQTSDGGYIIAGNTRSFGNGADDVYLIKTNPAGDTIWTRTFGGADFDWGNSVHQSSDGGFIVTGGTFSYGAGESDIYILKTDAEGNLLWTGIYGDTLSDIGYSVQQTIDSGYIIAGTVYSNENRINGTLIKINNSGDTLWTRTYGGTDLEQVFCARQTVDLGFILAGSSELYGSVNKDLYIIKTDSLGNEIWSGTYGGPGDDIASSIRRTPDEGYIIAGATTSYGAGNHDVYVIKISSEPTNVFNNGITWTPDYFVLHSNYPNPFNSSTTISFELVAPGNVKLEVYDLLGREMATLVDGYLESGYYDNKFVASNRPSGIYFYRLNIGNAVKTGRMVLLK
jgi:hypothetical protein